MVYKFRSLREPNLQVAIKDTDGDEHTVSFQKIHQIGQPPIGILETEETKIAEAMLADERNGVVYMDSNYVEKTAVVQPKATEKVISEKPKKKRTTKRKK